MEIRITERVALVAHNATCSNFCINSVDHVILNQFQKQLMTVLGAHIVVPSWFHFILLTASYTIPLSLHTAPKDDNSLFLLIHFLRFTCICTIIFNLCIVLTIRLLSRWMKLDLFILRILENVQYLLIARKYQAANAST